VLTVKEGKIKVDPGFSCLTPRFLPLLPEAYLIWILQDYNGTRSVLF
jgi:hypothetical protein